MESEQSIPVSQFLGGRVVMHLRARLGYQRCLVLGAVLASPLGLYERVRYGRRISKTRIVEDPIFIIGHWRSGTTHLHNLMSQDPQLGSLRMFQTLSPDCSVETFDRFVLLRGAGKRVRREVERSLLRVYRVATLHEGGRRLLLKNPVNTCRIPMLLRLFPTAKFIFIHRDPYAVFDSTMHLHRRILEVTSLQEVDEEAIEASVVALHQRVTETYLRDRAQIPSSQLIEIAYSDLVEKPEAILKQVYSSLGLPGFEAAAQPIATFLDSQRCDRKNTFERDPAKTVLVDTAWRADFEAWDYEHALIA